VRIIYRLIVILICAILLFCCCKEKTTTAYYRHINYFGVHNIKLKYPITPDTTKSDYYYRVTSDNRGRIVSLKFPEVGGQGNDPKAEYSEISISYSKDNEQWLFLDTKGSPIINEYGVYKKIYKLGRGGFLISSNNFDSTGKAVEDSFGVSKCLFKTDDNGLITEWLRLNIKGDTITDKKGNYRSKFSYNDIGFVVGYANYGRDGTLLEASDSIAAIRYKYDSFGNKIEESFFDKNNNPKGNIEDDAASIQYFYDETGRVVEWRYFGESGDLVKNRCPIVKIMYAENGRVAEYDCLGTNQTILKSTKFNDTGINSEIRSFDSNGNPTIDTSWGYAAYITTFDSAGNVVEENYLDEKMKPIIPKDFGFATIRSEFNSYRNRTKCSWFDPDGNICENKRLGCAILTYEYDYPKGIVTTVCRDYRGLVKDCNYGYAFRRSQYKNGKIIDDKYIDKAGNLITKKHFDIGGRPID
jgi:hypothetical protein